MHDDVPGPAGPFNTVNQANYPYCLDEAARLRIDAALDKYLRMAEPDRAALIDYIQQKGHFAVFGYGSLMGDPHAKPDEEYRGTLKGWKRGAFCSDRHYRGRPDELGITMGALPEEGASLYGLVQVQKSDQSANKSFEEKILDSIYKFAKRETSMNPIYESGYRVVDVETQEHGNVKAIICGASPDNPQYLGDLPVLLADGTCEGLSLEEKAAIIAACYGEPGASIRNTGISYWTYILHCTYNAGYEAEEDVRELVAMAMAARTSMYGREDVTPELLHNLYKLELTGKQGEAVAGYDKRAFERTLDPHFNDAKRWNIILQNARNALGRQDPLSENRRQVIEQNMRELEELVPTPRD